MFGEFKAFLTKSNALALAIGVISAARWARRQLARQRHHHAAHRLRPRRGGLRAAQDRAPGGESVDAAGNEVAEVAIRWPGSSTRSSCSSSSRSSFDRQDADQGGAGRATEPTEEAKLLTDIRDALRKG
jgi:hypothetical protein